MRRIFQVVFLLLLAPAAYAQVENVESLMTRRYLTCADIALNAQILIPEFYELNAQDTLTAIINYWEAHCGISEETTRCKILFAIDNHAFNENIYDTNILNYLIDYKNRINFQNDHYGKVYNYFNWGYNNLQRLEFDTFTDSLAKKLLDRDNLDDIEIFFLRMYSNQFENTFAMLGTEKFKGTVLQQLYDAEIEKWTKDVIPHGGFIAGAWIPTDNLSLLGAHPFLGVRGGAQFQKLTADITLGFKFLRSPNFYQISKNDSILNTNYFFGGYIGLDLGIEMFRIKNNEFYVIGGIAFDGFDALKSDGPDSEESISKSINSLNLNIGVGYKYVINYSNYIGLDLKFNRLDYKNTGGTDLSGNAFTINLIYGFLGNQYDIKRLKSLDYIK